MSDKYYHISKIDFVLISLLHVSNHRISQPQMSYVYFCNLTRYEQNQALANTNILEQNIIKSNYILTSDVKHLLDRSSILFTSVQV